MVSVSNVDYSRGTDMIKSFAIVVVVAWVSQAMAATDAPALVTGFDNNPIEVHAYGDVKKGYTLRVKVAFAFASQEDDDQLTANFKIGKRIVVKCKRETSRVLYGDFVDKAKDTKTNVYSCNITDKLKKKGKHSVSFDYMSTDQEKTYKKVATLKFEIKKGKKLFYASQDELVGPVYFIYDVDAMRHRYDHKHPKLWFRTRVKIPHSRSTPKNNIVRCKLDGKKVYKNKARAYPKTDINDEFSVYEIKMYAKHHIKEGSTSWGARESEQQWPFGDHPGKYECKLTMEGETKRKWSFTVNKEGFIEDACGPALGMDLGHGIINSNKSSNDHKHNKKAAAKNLMWLPKVPKACGGIL